MNVLLVLSFIAACIISMETESFPTTVDNLKRAVDEMNQKKSMFKNLTDDDKFSLYVVLEKDKERLQDYNELLQKDIVSETNLRLHYQSLLDFTELIKGLVEECYPIWAKPRDDYDFSDKIFETMFLNVKNRRILLLKIELKDSGVLEKDFITMVQDFLKFRNIRVHIKPLSNTQREKAYPELIRSTNEKQKATIRSILQYSYNVDVKSGKVETQPDAVPKFSTSEPLPTTVNPRELPSADIIIQRTDELRKNKNFMVITNPQTWMLNEDQLQNVSRTNQLPNDAPLACYAPNKDTTYILFKSFGSAYNALQNLKFEEECNRDIDKANKNSDLKSTAEPNANIVKLMTKVKTYLKNIHPDVAYQIITRKQNHVVFLRFSNAEKLLIAYEILNRTCAGKNKKLMWPPPPDLSTIDWYQMFGYWLLP